MMADRQPGTARPLSLGLICLLVGMAIASLGWGNDASTVDASSARRWVEPLVVQGWLDELSFECETGIWAMTAASQVRRLGAAWQHQPDQVTARVAALAESVKNAEPLAARLTDDSMARRLRRASMALGRRVELWRRAFSACDPVEAAALLTRIERWEAYNRTSDAVALAQMIADFSQSRRAGQQDLGAWLDSVYGNANLRVAVSSQLLNRFMPEREPEQGEVNDRVLGIPVHGQSTTQMKIGAEFVPDPNRLRLALVVQGDVTARTTSSAGPARFVNSSESTYVARKELELRADGIALEPTKVEVDNRTRLEAVGTTLDRVPLLGFMAKNTAKNQHQRKQPAANRETEGKISDEVRRRVDAETRQQVEQGVEKLRQRLLGPLTELSIQPTLISGETTEDRMASRFRFGSAHQLGGYSPRPTAPSDSLFSTQIHESLINNCLDQLGLNGRKFTLPELGKHLTERLQLEQPIATNPDHEDVTITFAAKDAISVRCDQDQVTIRVAVVEMTKGSTAWRDFEVVAFYRPEISGRSARLARDGVINLVNSRLSTRQQLAIRGVFSSVFSKNKPWKISPEQLETDDRLRDLAITQFLIEDGWIGVAFGPDRLASQNRPTQR